MPLPRLAERSSLLEIGKLFKMHQLHSFLWPILVPIFDRDGKQDPMSRGPNEEFRMER